MWLLAIMAMLSAATAQTGAQTGARTMSESEYYYYRYKKYGPKNRTTTAKASTPSTSTTYTTTTTSFSSSTPTILTTTTFMDLYYTGYLVGVLDFFLLSNRRALKPAGLAVVIGFGLALALALATSIGACYFFCRCSNEEFDKDDCIEETDQADVEVELVPEAKESKAEESGDDDLHEKEMLPSSDLHILPDSSRTRSSSDGSMMATLEEDADSIRPRHHSRNSSVDSVKRPPRPFPNMFD